MSNYTFTISAFATTPVSDCTMDWWYCLPPGMNITIGSSFTARVLQDNGTTITLDTPLSATISGAKIYWQAGQVSYMVP